nr:reverse transcriptase domain-containing protein [Tanacetum cinerariifolium]
MVGLATLFYWSGMRKSVEDFIKQCLVSYHSSIKMSPFQALYGRMPLTVVPYPPGASKVAVAEDSLMERDELLRQLKSNLLAAKEHMELKANKRRREVEFQVGDMVLVKLQRYRQLTLAKRLSNKLAKRYYGPYEMVERIGKVAYRLALPATSKIHPVFQVSILKAFLGKGDEAVTELPEEVQDGRPREHPVAVYDSREVLQNGKAIRQVLVQWDNGSPEEATWECLSDFQNAYPDYNLEDMVVFKERRSVTPAVQRSVRVRRKRNAPSWQQDFVMGVRTHLKWCYRWYEEIVSIGAFIAHGRKRYEVTPQSDGFQAQFAALHAELQETKELVQVRHGGRGDPGSLLPRSMRLDVPKFNGADPETQYQSEFEKLMNRVTDISETLLISFYISGLKPTIQRELLITKPTTLGDAFSLARITEARLEDQSPTSTPATKTIASVITKNSQHPALRLHNLIRGLINSLDTRDYVKIRTTLLPGHSSHPYFCINKLVPSVGPNTRSYFEKNV